MRNLALAVKRLMPKSLFGRALMILVLPILLLQVIVALVFIQRHYDGVTAQMAGSVARELSFAIERVERAPDVDTARDALAEMAEPLGLTLGLVEDGQVVPGTRRALSDLTGAVIAETLDFFILQPVAVDLVTFSKHVDARVQTSEGTLRALIPRRQMNAANPHLLLVWMSVSSILLTAIAILFLRNQVRPIRELAKAAVAFGRGRSVGFRPSGAEEVRRVQLARVGLASDHPAQPRRVLARELTRHQARGLRIETEDADRGQRPFPVARGTEESPKPEVGRAEVDDGASQPVELASQRY